MSTRISLLYPSADTLSEVEYRFIVLDGLDFVLDGAVYRARETKRHKMKAVGVWGRIDKRGNTMERPGVPDNVKADALKKIMESVRFVD